MQYADVSADIGTCRRDQYERDTPSRTESAPAEEERGRKTSFEALNETDSKSEEDEYERDRSIESPDASNSTTTSSSK